MQTLIELLTTISVDFLAAIQKILGVAVVGILVLFIAERTLIRRHIASEILPLWSMLMAYFLTLRARLDEIERRKRDRSVDNIETILGRIDDPDLDEKSVDLVFIVDAYHEFSHPLEMGEAIYGALQPGGHLIVVEDRGEDRLHSASLHNMTEAQARKEITALGFTWLRTETFLPQQHFLVFQKPASP